MSKFVFHAMIILLLGLSHWVTAQEKSAKAPEQRASMKTPGEPERKGKPVGNSQKVEKPTNTSEQVPSAKVSADAGKNAESIQASQSMELSIVRKKNEKDSVLGRDGGRQSETLSMRMGESLNIEATGSTANKIREELKNVPASRALVLYLDGVRMANLPVSPQEVTPKGSLQVSFHLTRDSHDDENRKAWDTLLRMQNSYIMKPEVALGLGNNIPWAVQTVFPFEFYIAQGGTIWIIFLVGLVILLLTFFGLVKHPTALRDSKDAGFYSLGKTQMAFWGLLVVLAFAGVWIVTGTMERIPPQVLILLGISGATGLTAILIGQNKKALSESDKQTAIAKLREEQQKLQKEQLTAPNTFPQTSQDRLTAIDAELAELTKHPAQSTEMAYFWKDICDDGNGLSFHRLQVVIWTMVLGVVFVWSVAQVMSMPEFPETLLVLMGISSGTYLGFKIPEKQ